MAASRPARSRQRLFNLQEVIEELYIGTDSDCEIDASDDGDSVYSLDDISCEEETDSDTQGKSAVLNWFNSRHIMPHALLLYKQVDL